MWILRKLRSRLFLRYLCAVIGIFTTVSLLTIQQNVIKLEGNEDNQARFGFPGVKKNGNPAHSSGSSQHYTFLKVDTFVKSFLLRYNRINSTFVSKHEESYPSFLKRLNLLKKKGITLLDMDKNTAMNPLERFHSGMNQYYMYDPNDEGLIQDLLMNLNTLPIVATEGMPTLGSQLKMKLTFSDGSKARFKPGRNLRDGETAANTFFFDDFEKSRAEIAGFHLDKMLGFNRAVPTVGRVLNMTRDLATLFSNQSYVEHVYTSPAGNLCFVAQCVQYCGVDFPFCGHPNVIEGSVSVALPALRIWPRQSTKYPYARIYNIEEKAGWENDNTFCDTQVKQNFSLHKLLEFTELSIFDFMIGNMDRHGFETFANLQVDHFVPVFDSARGFGTSKHDCMSCLAPLQQCCQIRLSTLAKLIKLYQGPDSLSQVMRKSLTSDPLSPILREPFLDALDRRLGKVINAVSDCISDGRSWDDVVVVNEGLP